DHGGSKVAVLGYGESPSSKASALGSAQADRLAGLTTPYVNVSLPFGTINVTALVLGMKAANIDSFDDPIDGNTTLAIVTTGSQAGIKWKVANFATGYGGTILDNPSAIAAAQGAYFSVEQVPVELHTAVTMAEQAAFKQYANFTGTPGFDWWQGWS